MGEEKVSYGPKDLKNTFAELKDFADFILIPLFDRVTNRFFSDLNHNYSKYGVTDGKRLEKYGGGWNINPSYNLVLDGKIITMTLQDVDIDVKDEDEMWWMAESIIFEGKKEQTEKMLQKVKDFAGQQKLEELVNEARGN